MKKKRWFRNKKWNQRIRKIFSLVTLTVIVAFCLWWMLFGSPHAIRW